MSEVTTLITIRNTAIDPPPDKKRPYFARVHLDQSGDSFIHQFDRITYDGAGRDRAKVFSFQARFGEMFEARLAYRTLDISHADEEVLRFHNKMLWFEIDREGAVWDLKTRAAALFRAGEHRDAARKKGYALDRYITAKPLAHPCIKATPMIFDDYSRLLVDKGFRREAS